MQNEIKNYSITGMTCSACSARVEKVVSNIEKYGNTSAASIPIALAESVEKGKVKLGSTAILCGFGAGMTWGGAIVKLREGIC